MMYDWEKMASVVARRLVEDGQTRILQRIYEGVTSNWDLDVADDKSSKDHSLIHLVWRKFPRNRHPSEERRSTAVSTQTEEGSSATLGSEEGSSAMLGLATSAGLTRLPLKFGPRKILDQQSIEIYSGSDLGNLFATESIPTSDAGWTSDCSPSSTDSVAQEGASFKFPAKGRTSKPKIFESKSPTKLDNRYKCLEENKPENGDTLGEIVRNSPSIDKSHKRNTSSKVKSPPELSYETQLRQLKASINTNNKPSPENVLFDMPTTSSSGIPVVGGSPPPILPVSAVVSAPEVMFVPDQASLYTYDQEYDVLDEERQQWKLGLQNSAIRWEELSLKAKKCMDDYNSMMDSFGITRAAVNHPP